ncbi:MAG: hypothetical protein PF568_00220 [Deltaproteobacteria bacterium]|nr:hypothetical protein [Deltaproteobacteria bacterium]
MDDDVLGAAGEKELAMGQVGQVAGVKPAVVKKLSGLPAVAEVAAGG